MRAQKKKNAENVANSFATNAGISMDVTTATGDIAATVAKAMKMSFANNVHERIYFASIKV